MFRDQNEDKNGFFNEGLDVCSDESNLQKFDCDNTKIEIIRLKYNQESLFREMAYRKPSSKSFIAKKFNNVNKKAIRTCAIESFPIITWLYSYKKDDFASDLISGCTVAIMQIPQGMGYSLLANLPPIVGIYMAFFPVLIYALFGTSKHNSMGTFAVISIMVGKCITTYSYQYSDSSIAKQAAYSPIEVATLLCFLVGTMQLIMWLLRLGIMSFLLSESLVSGFTTGAAIHVLTSQVKDLLGIELPGINGNFKLVKTYVEIFSQVNSNRFNVTSIILSTLTILLLLLNNEILKPILARKTKIPIPIELFVVVGGTLFSKYIRLYENFNVILIGHIPLGFPSMTICRFDLWKELLLDSIAISIVSYSITVSMALILGQKLKYEINFNQELLAMGLGNIFGSFFSCFPYSASLSRSLIQQNVGGKTQLASLISCVLLFFVLMWIGPFFEDLPRCILASIIVIAIKGMVMQVKDFKNFKRKSNSDALVWMCTFLAVIFLSIDIGLLIGICLSILCIFCNGLKCYVCVLGNVPNTDLFLDIDNFQKAVEIPYVKILQLSGSINFATKVFLRNQICSKLKINLIKELKIKELNNNADKSNKNLTSNINFKHLILDFGSLTSIDASSIVMLSDLIKDLNKLDLKVSITSCSSSRIYEVLLKNEFEFMHIMYPSIQDVEVGIL
ncbi:hypothetical protein PVAND_011760 [Polypedilum vanderplanki]|uniref:STAS domain-containing protein n=1 Tax=Polypedilum vanderplanki TaxID=319348 RepID=A0A9J6CKM2_POLVA|nr:hypothetical protein PVAND_011760 [Polypedilum vanderplanki]